MPHLCARQEITVYDLKPPADPAVAFVQGDVCDPPALAEAMQGKDALIYMAMGSFRPDAVNGGPGDAAVQSQFDVHVKGLYLALRAGHLSGVSHGVYTSSMSVYRGLAWRAGESRYFADESEPADARNLYGLTKRLGEELCINACEQWGMSVNMLRLCWPRSDERWYAETKPGVPTMATTATDTARAILAALELRAGCQAFMISGDYEHKLMNMSKARDVLGWAPLARPRG